MANVRAKNSKKSPQSAPPEAGPAPVVDAPKKLISVSLKDFPEERSAEILRRPILGISVGKEDFEGDKLAKTVACLKLNQEHITKLDVLVGGVLQRWNWWNFSQKLDDAQLANLMNDKDITPDIQIPELAYQLSQIFYGLAKESEDEWIRRNSMIVISGSPVKYRPKFIRWEELVPIDKKSSIVEKYENKQPANAGKYQDYVTLVSKACALPDSDMIKAISHTCSEFLLKKKPEIEVETQRLVEANPNLQHLSKEDWMDLVFTCSYNYLLEEYPLLFPTLHDRGYTSVLYAGSISQVGTEHLKLFPKQQMGWVNIVQKHIKQNLPPKTTYVAEEDAPIPVAEQPATKRKPGKVPGSALKIITLLGNRSISDHSMRTETPNPLLVEESIPPVEQKEVSEQPRTLNEVVHEVHQHHHLQPLTSRSNQSDSDTDSQYSHSQLFVSGKRSDIAATDVESPYSSQSLYTPSSGYSASSSPMPIPQSSSPAPSPVRSSDGLSKSASSLPAGFFQHHKTTDKSKFKTSVSNESLQQTKKGKLKQQPQVTHSQSEATNGLRRK